MNVISPHFRTPVSRSVFFSNTTHLVSDVDPHKVFLPKHISAAHLCGRKELKGVLCSAGRTTARKDTFQTPSGVSTMRQNTGPRCLLSAFQCWIVTSVLQDTGGLSCSGMLVPVSVVRLQQHALGLLPCGLHSSAMPQPYLTHTRSSCLQRPLNCLKNWVMASSLCPHTTVWPDSNLHLQRALELRGAAVFLMTCTL